MLHLLFSCISCKETLNDFGHFPICPICAESLIFCPELCNTCGGPACLNQPFEDCLRPWVEPDLIASYTANYLLIASSYRVLKRWKIHTGLLFDRQVLKPAPQVFEKLTKLRADALVPIPQDFIRSWKMRGSRALKISQWISKSLQIPILPLLLAPQRRRNQKRQAELSLRERIENPIHFYPNPETLELGSPPHSVILVDDFYTTGHTVRQAARSLKEMGVERVHVFCLGLRPALEKIK